MKQYLVLGLETSVAWPEEDTTVRYRGYNLLLRPGSDELAPSIVLAYEPPITFQDALLIARRFLSSLAWVEGHYIRETIITGGTFPVKVGKALQSNIVCLGFRADYLPAPSDPKALLALALYREALSINSVPYQFLGFFKIINVFRETGNQQKNWITAALPHIQNPDALKRLSILQTQHGDIAAYLYTSGRCAVAHAFGTPVVDPEDPEATERLRADLPVIKALAAYLIEHEFGVQTKSTVLQEHIYELNGFRDLLGPDLINRLKSRTAVHQNDLPSFPRINVRIRNKIQLPSFENMTTQFMDVTDGIIKLHCKSTSNLLEMSIVLNFADERLQCDLIQGVNLVDDGSVLPAQHRIDELVLLTDLLLNGQFEVWDAQQNVLLGRCDPYIPCNINLGETVFNIQNMIANLEEDIAERSSIAPGAD